VIPHDFKGKAKRLDAVDYAHIGRLIRVGEDEIRAVIEVETAGGGFDGLGRPKMLFEPHVFWRELGEQKRARAEVAKLAYRKWGALPYPKDSYPRLALACALDRPSALRSASWGLGQIMGFNHKSAGYYSAEAMVEAFLDDEETHLVAMVHFIRSEGLDDDLREHRWEGFARGYNGAGYASHGYHTKLAAAFAKWRARPDAVRA
jgi:hypothetical protein